MPAQQGPNKSIQQMLGTAGDKAWAETKDLPPLEHTSDRLPGGIKGGIAQVKKIWIDEYKKGADNGKPFFMATAVILSPTTFTDKNGTTYNLKGRHTQIGPEPLFDTLTRKGKRRTYAEHFHYMKSVLQDLGITDPNALKPVNLAATFNALINAKVCVRFQTSELPKQVIRETSPGKFQLYEEQNGGTYKLVTYQDQDKKSWRTMQEAQKANPYAGRDPSVYQEWLGSCPRPVAAPTANGQPPEETGVIDETGGGTEVEEAGTEEVVGGEEAGVVEEPEAVAEEATDSSNADGATDDTPAEEQNAGPEEVDLAALVEMANSPAEGPAEGEEPSEEFVAKSEAHAALKAAAMDLGYGEEEVDTANAWQDVADLIAAGPRPTEEEAAAEEEAPEPEPEPEPTPAQKPAAKAPAKEPAKPAAAKPAAAAAKVPAKPKEPKVGDSGWKYQFKDAKGKVTSTVQVEVLTVSTKNKTVTAKNLEKGSTINGMDKKPYPIKWADLIPAK